MPDDLRHGQQLRQQLLLLGQRLPPEGRQRHGLHGDQPVHERLLRRWFLLQRSMHGRLRRLRRQMAAGETIVTFTRRG